MSHKTTALDASAIASLREISGDDSLLKQLVQVFLGEVPLAFSKIDEAIESADAATLFREAHTLKSTSAALGASDMHALCIEIEMMAKQGQLSGVAKLVSALRKTFSETSVALQIEAGLRKAA